MILRRTFVLLVFGALVAAACGGDASTSPAPEPVKVTQVGLFWGLGTTPCQGPVTMTFTVKVFSAHVGDAVVVSLTGPGLPGTITENLTADTELIQKQYPVAQVAPGASAVWNALVISVAGKTPDTIPGGGRTAQSSASC